MKKSIFVFIAPFLLLSTPVLSQTEIGLTLSPSLSANRVSTGDNSGSVKPDAARIKLAFGAYADFFLKENYYLSSGITLTPKTAGIKYVSATAGPTVESFRLQYLQIPLTLKLYTNEVALDKRIFVQLGLLNEIKINEKRRSQNAAISGNEVIGGFKFFDFSALLRGGLDFRIGYDTSVFAGISYTRGLTNVLIDYSYPDTSINIKNDLVSLDFGIKF